jgi:hypothetical protein
VRAILKSWNWEIGPFLTKNDLGALFAVFCFMANNVGKVLEEAKLEITSEGFKSGRDP